ncbi:TIGR04211 family SH3 domain-containing protein [Celerinatantimonas sp. MCCC 1A17872]|uniref:TIGR04211 family SH3 domain-containing protein n=1 Tax=Celerinatantimonas sp. MCCC 1A17872 TaxID=3177514 RepID=UPI0038CA1275
MRYKLLLSVLAAGLSFSTLAAQRYVTNDLFIYMHSGPGNNYRIVGTVNAGEKVNEIEYDQDSQFAHVKVANSDKDGWIEADKLTNTPSLQTQLSAATDQLKSTQQKLSDLQKSSEQSSDDKSKLITQLQQQLKTEQQRTTDMNTHLSKLVSENKKLTVKLGNIQQDVQMQWLIKGGIVAGGGLIIGLIIPYLPRRRKRNSDRWM